VAALPDGSFVFAEDGGVRVVDRMGPIMAVAGAGEPGSTGDGGPATLARVWPTDIAPLPGGGFLIAQCDEAACHSSGGSRRHCEVSPRTAPSRRSPRTSAARTRLRPLPTQRNARQ
jgi:hypothetical protein